MKRRLALSGGLIMGVLLWSGTALPQSKPGDCDKVAAPEKVAGEVVKVDPNQGKLTLRGIDGTIHEFQVSRETLQEYKVGDRIEAKLRSRTDCPQ